MYIKKGSLCRESLSGNPILKNSNGQAYEVSFIAAFIWERLDGETSLPLIKEEVTKVGDISQEKLGEIWDLVLTELEKVGLIYNRDHEIS